MVFHEKERVDKRDVLGHVRHGTVAQRARGCHAVWPHQGAGRDAAPPHVPVHEAVAAGKAKRVASVPGHHERVAKRRDLHLLGTRVQALGAQPEGDHPVGVGSRHQGGIEAGRRRQRRGRIQERARGPVTGRGIHRSQPDLHLVALGEEHQAKIRGFRDQAHSAPGIVVRGEGQPAKRAPAKRRSVEKVHRGTVIHGRAHQLGQHGPRVQAGQGVRVPQVHVHQGRVGRGGDQDHHVFEQGMGRHRREPDVARTVQEVPLERGERRIAAVRPHGRDLERTPIGPAPVVAMRTVAGERVLRVRGLGAVAPVGALAPGTQEEVEVYPFVGTGHQHVGQKTVVAAGHGLLAAHQVACGGMGDEGLAVPPALVPGDQAERGAVQEQEAGAVAAHDVQGIVEVRGHRGVRARYQVRAF